jgi:hypothetical protein
MRLSFYLMGMCAALILAIGCSGSEEAQTPENERYTLSNLNRIYGRMQETELSDLKDDLSVIINERLSCYSKNLKTFERVRECRKKYVRSIVTLCRKRIKSAPRLGDAILCFQYCPISHAVCMGDSIDCENVDCVSSEARCIEYCLDVHWRGGTFPFIVTLPQGGETAGGLRGGE